MRHTSPQLPLTAPWIAHAHAAACLADVDSIFAVERQAFSDPWSRDSFVRVVGNPAVYCGCARRADDPELLGYVVAWFAADEAEIANLAVAPAFHGAGIGRRLLDSALAEARARGARTVYLEVRDSNERASSPRRAGKESFC